MFPFLDAGLQIGIAMSVLYALLAVTSLSVKLARGTRTPGTLSHQVNAWWRIFPVVSLSLLTYPLGLLALACLIYLLAAFELDAYHDGSRFTFWRTIAVVAGGLAWASAQSPSTGLLLALLLIAIQALQCWLDFNRNTLVWLLVVATASAMLVIAAFPTLPFGERTNLSWLFYLFILTALNDIAQFVSGKLFGKHKIAPSIIPNKTWQGLLGGIAISQLISLVLGTYLSLANPLTLAIYALLLSIAGFLGDLLFSAAKRRLGIKDFSTLIPGHGGILDRVDSLVLTAPLLYCLLRTTQ